MRSPRSGTANEILVASEGVQLRAVAVAQGRPVDVMTVPRGATGAIGSLYLGRVVRHMAAIGGAFVDIGLERPAFLNLDKTVPPEGKPVLVQIVAAETPDKAAGVSTRIALEGRFAVLLPRGEGVAVSRRLEPSSRAHLQAIARRLARTGEGLVIRAAAQDAEEEVIAAEIEALRQLWAGVAAKLDTAPPASLYAEPGLRRILCAFGGPPDARFVFADTETAQQARVLARTLGPDLAAHIDDARDPSLFERHGIADLLAQASDKVVSLPSGGRLTIEATTALTAIDVDTASGSAAGKAALVTNLEAATEVARQLRFREIGGLVLVDFIRMPRKAEQERVRRVLTDAVESDRMPVQILGWTKAGLLELIRSRARRET